MYSYEDRMSKHTTQGFVQMVWAPPSYRYLHCALRSARLAISSSTSKWRPSWNAPSLPSTLPRRCFSCTESRWIPAALSTCS